MNRIRVAIVGCGAITELAYLPALARLSDVEIACLVDVDRARARLLADRYGVTSTVGDARELAGGVDVAAVALPHDLHRPVGCALMEHGINVFCEKPLACTATDAEAMVTCAEQHGVRLGVGNIRRLFWNSGAVRQVITSGRLGRLVHVRCDEGSVYDWPTVSGFFFDRRRAGGGVLMDTGAHVLDLLLWWLGEYPVSITYADDDYGGVEAECTARFSFRSGIDAEVSLSRIAKLRNRYVLRFTGGEIAYHPHDYSAIAVRPTGKRARLERGPNHSFEAYFATMLAGFVDAVRTGAPSPLEGRSVLPSIRLIGDCYAAATRLVAPWLEGREVADATA
jgi:predicted dehydrogenase